MMMVMMMTTTVVVVGWRMVMEMKLEEKLLEEKSSEK